MEDSAWSIVDARDSPQVRRLAFGNELGSPSEVGGRRGKGDGARRGRAVICGYRDGEMAALSMRRNKFHGEWNYTLLTKGIQTLCYY